jgi:aminoglycoside/choline kinase family phosphotransferase
LPDGEYMSGRLECLANSGWVPVRIVRLAGDASTRIYLRAWYADGSTALVMLQPDPGRGQEASFIDVHSFLERLGLPVPKVHFHEPDQGVVVLEDMGDDLLETVAARSDEPRIRSLYTDAVNLLLQMRKRARGISSGCGAFALAFDEAKLMEELEFFMTHFIRGLCSLNPPTGAESTLREFFATISRILAGEPRIFTHRDFHSRNLILRDGRLFMIDFQDARMGPSQYDLASLLRDSYVRLPDPLVDDLIAYYCDQTHESDRERFRFIFNIMSLQRNIKALGTFGYQTSVRNSTRYISSIPRTGAYVAHTIGLHPELAPFRAAVEEYICSPATEFRIETVNGRDAHST